MVPFTNGGLWPVPATHLAPTNPYPRLPSPTGIKLIFGDEHNAFGGAGADPECEKQVLQVQHETQPAHFSRAHTFAVTPTF